MEENKDKKDDKLVTLAIHTYEKAQILKTLLESEGIPVVINNVNLIQPVVSAGVRVRIKESDLPHALRIIEDSNWLNEDDETEEKPKKHIEKILIPVDFSDYSIRACEIGINYAARMNAKAMIFHVYFTSFLPSALPLGEYGSTIGMGEEQSLLAILNNVKKEMENLMQQIHKKMDEGTLPHVDVEHDIREGLPEEEIIRFGKEYRPSLIVMGTRGKDQKDLDLIGSVTGEVIEMARVPTLAVPENVPFNDLSAVKNIAFATSFNQRDLMAFDQLVEVFRKYEVNIHLFNISTSKDQWNEIRLSGIKDYFNKQYPELPITYSVLNDGDLLLSIEKFVREKQIDLISLSTYRRNIFARLFNPSMARKMLFHTDTPLMVIPAKNS